MAEKYSDRICELVREFRPDDALNIALKIGAFTHGSAEQIATESLFHAEQRSFPTPRNEVLAEPLAVQPSHTRVAETGVSARAASRPRDLVRGTDVEGSLKHPHHLFENYTFNSFVEGKSNQLALAAAQQVAENPGNSYNPLFLYGGVGLGKTHLMHAVGNALKARRPDAKVVYLHSERFVADMVKALQLNAITDFKRY